MEKILINSVERKEGKNDPYWVIKFNHEKSATVWEEKIGNFLFANIGKYVEAVISEGSFRGKTTCNIREVNFDLTVGQTPVGSELEAPVAPAATSPSPQETKGSAPNPQRVGLFLKLAVEMAIVHPNDGMTVEENLCENIQEIKRLEDFTVKLLSLG